MKALVLQKPGHFAFADKALPVARAGEVLVKVRCVGVCGTDYHGYRGTHPLVTYPRVLGHELGVEVVEGEGYRRGDRCAVEPYLNCGKCPACAAGRTNCCERLEVYGVHLDGGMQEMMVVPSAKLYRSSQLTFEELALVETLGIGAHAVRRAELKQDEWVLVVGAGPIGLSVVEFARAAGVRLIVSDVSERRREFCRQRCPVANVLDGRGDVGGQLPEVTGGVLPSVIFDATGNRDSMEQCVQWVGHGGRIVFVGLVSGHVALDDALFHRKEVTLLASRNSTAEDFRHVVKMMEQGAVDVRGWVTHQVELDDVPGQFVEWMKSDAGVVKAVVKLGDLSCRVN
jgi:2-desacetyl-2-hydroxyethyl bacteriochlorophyllide A dehydrogenase